MKKRNIRRFTMAELILCLFLFTANGVLLVAGAVGANQNGRAHLCMNNLKTLGAAFALYAENNDGYAVPYSGGSRDRLRASDGWHSQLAGLAGRWQGGFRESALLHCPEIPPPGGEHYTVHHYGFNSIFWGNSYAEGEAIPPLKLSSVRFAPQRMVLADALPFEPWAREKYPGFQKSWGGANLRNYKSYTPADGKGYEQKSSVWGGIHTRHGNGEMSNVLFGDGGARAVPYGEFRSDEDAVWGFYSEYKAYIYPDDERQRISF